MLVHTGTALISTPPSCAEATSGKGTTNKPEKIEAMMMMMMMMMVVVVVMMMNIGMS